jgi:calcineurin-like phosphoesterase family protein
MKISIDPVIAGRIKAAWNKLSSDQRGQLAPLVLEANQQAVTVTQTGKAPADPAVAHHLVLAHSVLNNDSDGVAASLESGVVIVVGPDGVIWGTGKYQQFDPGWTEALAVYLETLALGGKHPFMASPQVIPMPDEVQIGLVGDWGTGDWRPALNPAPSTDVGNHLRFLQPDLTIHLGDVYYAGTSDQEQHLLVNIWPKGSLGSLALSSNHEMYSGAKPYFDAITNPESPFAMQKGCSYFALENTNWVVVGLDSAYFSPDSNLYMDGALGPAEGTQVQFLQRQVAKGKRVIVLTHHNGLTQDGLSTTGLWEEVMSGFPAGTGPAYWYWGHAHAGVAYQPKPPREGEPASILCRCSGHGALPWGHATELDNNPNVVWYENRLARDPDIPQRVLNGFAMLYLDGGNIEEVFYDENGGEAWDSQGA